MFNSTVIADARADAKAGFPNESCGIVVADTYIPYDNLAEDPRAGFVINEASVNQYIMSGELQAVIHSHPQSGTWGRSCPSKHDMEGQVATGVPWGIIDTDGDIVNTPYWWGDFLLDEELLGKEFHAGVNDCYSLIRKWYKQKRGIILDEFPRDDAWWVSDEDMYVKGFAQAGFYRIDKSQLQDGDVLLSKVMSVKINHGGIYLSNKEDGYGTLIHHLPKRLSRREAANPWIDRTDIFLRYRNVK